MNCKVRIFMKCVGLFTALVVGGTSCFSTPSTARVINNDVLTVQLQEPVTLEEVQITSNLLTEEGQIILLKNEDFKDRKLELPIKVSGESLKQARSAAVTVQATSSNDEKMQVSLDNDKIDFGKNNQVILTIEMVEQNESEADKMQTLSGNNFSRTVSGSNLGQEDSVTEPEEETQETLSAEVSFTYGEKTYSATILIVENTETGNITGDLSYCQSQYDPKELITMIGSAESDCIVSGFPAMAGYILDEEHYLLYNGGSILIPAGKEIKIDLSKIEQKEKLSITTGAGKSYTITYQELPKLEHTEQPLILSEEGVILPITDWGNINPVVLVEQLTIGAESLVWSETELVAVGKTEDGKLQMIPDEAVAGTYQATVLWKENEITLYEMEIPFFIQYTGVDQGGNTQ